jgi:hypothetical protein
MIVVSPFSEYGDGRRLRQTPPPRAIRGRHHEGVDRPFTFYSAISISSHCQQHLRRTEVEALWVQ